MLRCFRVIIDAVTRGFGAEADNESEFFCTFLCNLNTVGMAIQAILQNVGDLGNFPYP